MMYVQLIVLFTLFTLFISIMLTGFVKQRPALFILGSFGLVYYLIRPVMLYGGIYENFAYLNNGHEYPTYSSLFAFNLFVLISYFILAFTYFILDSRLSLALNLGHKSCGFNRCVLIFLCNVVVGVFEIFFPYYFVLAMTLLITIFLYLEFSANKFHISRFLVFFFSFLITVYLVSLSTDRRDWMAVILILLFVYAFSGVRKNIVSFSYKSAIAFLLIVYIAIALRTDGILKPVAVYDRLVGDNFIAMIEVETDFSIVYDDTSLLFGNEMSNHGYLFGITLAKPLFSVIPRSIWEDKPITISRLYSKHFNPDFYNTGGSQPVTFLGEYYWNFGWFSLVLLPLFAIYLLFLDSNVLKGKDNSSFLNISFGLAGSAFMFHMLRGPTDTFWLVQLYLLVGIVILGLLKRGQWKLSTS